MSIHAVDNYIVRLWREGLTLQQIAYNVRSSGLLIKNIAKIVAISEMHVTFGKYDLQDKCMIIPSIINYDVRQL